MKLRKILLPARAKRLWRLGGPVVLSLVVLGAGCSLMQTINVNGSAGNTNTAVNASANANISASITYSGQAGKNALELLTASHKVDTSAQGFVNAIDSIKPGDHQYWAFYINGKLSDVGAKDYQTKTTDAIEWKLESF